MKLFFVLIGLVLLVSVSGISFFAQEGKEKCFSDELPGRQVIIVYHELMSTPEMEKAAKNKKQDQKGKLLTQGLEFRVYDPHDAMVHQTNVKPGPNKFSLTSQQMGRYKFCVFKSKSFWKSGEYKYKMKIQQGVDFHLEDAANKTHVMNLQERIDGLTNRTKDFVRLQSLNREQEDKLTTQSILINQRVVQTTIVQIIILLISGTYQIWSLRRFFKERFLM